MKISRYILIFLLGFFIARFWYKKDVNNYQKEETQLFLSTVQNLSKLVVSRATFSEVYSYQDSKKYFYDVLTFDKKAMVTVNATIEVGYDLSKLEIQIDSTAKKIYINKIPKEEVSINPEVKYFDLQQSQFNAFSKEDLNAINKKSIEKVKNSTDIKKVKEEAQVRLFEEISKIYQLSSVFNWEVVDNTKTISLDEIRSKLD